MCWLFKFKRWNLGQGKGEEIRQNRGFNISSSNYLISPLDGDKHKPAEYQEENLDAEEFRDSALEKALN